MKKVLLVTGSIVLAAGLVGCSSTKVYRTTMDRQDAQVAGNQGVIFGPTPAPHQVVNPQREIVGVDMELATVSEVAKPLKAKQSQRTIDKGVNGNTGIISSQGQQETPEAQQPAAAVQEAAPAVQEPAPAPVQQHKPVEKIK